MSYLFIIQADQKLDLNGLSNPFMLTSFLILIFLLFVYTKSFYLPKYEVYDLTCFLMSSQYLNCILNFLLILPDSTGTGVDKEISLKPDPHIFYFFLD